jgi:hypothetical protein
MVIDGYDALLSRHERNLRTAWEPSCSVLNPHTHDGGQRRAERYRKKGPLKGVASVLDSTYRSKNNEFIALSGNRVNFGGIVCRHAGLEQPLAIGKFHRKQKEEPRKGRRKELRENK